MNSQQKLDKINLILKHNEVTQLFISVLQELDKLKTTDVEDQLLKVKMRQNLLIIQEKLISLQLSILGDEKES
ncbi:hypothetical protein [Metabacillus halosaccharovorans]|uniref:hypothetical protein n=1 Tax=Metabacillus halosaccharovorans TaxID=930124 RepID=UPI00203E3E40|nr:hypothetical protein [Metabacillus halosaccharovorans]MCM3442309.1 hypothetical protein [Metabacillus halosaccharovorans]